MYALLVASCPSSCLELFLFILNIHSCYFKQTTSSASSISGLRGNLWNLIMHIYIMLTKLSEHSKSCCVQSVYFNQNFKKQQKTIRPIQNTDCGIRTAFENDWKKVSFVMFGTCGSAVVGGWWGRGSEIVAAYEKQQRQKLRRWSGNCIRVNWRGWLGIISYLRNYQFITEVLMIPFFDSDQLIKNLFVSEE